MLMSDIDRFIEARRAAGFRFEGASWLLRSFGRFAAGRGEQLVRSESVIAWAALTPGARQRVRRLGAVRLLAQTAPRGTTTPSSAPTVGVLQSVSSPFPGSALGTGRHPPWSGRPRKRRGRCSGRRPCLIGVGFPLSGPRDKACTHMLTSSLRRHAWRTALDSLRSLRVRPRSESLAERPRHRHSLRRVGPCSSHTHTHTERCHGIRSSWQLGDWRGRVAVHCLTVFTLGPAPAHGVS